MGNKRKDLTSEFGEHDDWVVRRIQDFFIAFDDIQGECYSKIFNKLYIDKNSLTLDTIRNQFGYSENSFLRARKKIARVIEVYKVSSKK